MPKVRLSQKFIDGTHNLGAARKIDYFDSGCTGLLLEVRQSGKSYYLRYRNEHGTTKQRKIADAQVISLSDARKLAKEKLTQLAQGEDPFELSKELKKVPKFGEFVADSYMPHIKGYKRSWVTDESLLRNHILPAIGNLHMDQITRRNLVDLFSRHRQDHKPGSTNRIIILCRYIFNCAIKWETSGVIKNPSAGIALLQENNQRERYLTSAEAKLLFEVLEKSEAPMLKYIISMLLLTGARKNEVLNAKWEDFDRVQRLWTIEFNKSGKTRYIPLSDGVLQLLDAVPKIEGSDYVFANPKTGKPFVQIFTAWDTARKKAGLQDVRIHDLRHSFASFLINSGRSLYEVQKILGHTQIKTTQRYSHLSQDSLIAAANTATKSIPLSSIMPQATKQIPMVAVN